MTFAEAYKVMEAISIVANTKMSGIDIDDQIGIVKLMVENLMEARDKGFELDKNGGAE